MLKGFDILTKNERMNSHRDVQQNSFRITSNNILQGNSQFQQPKKHTIEDERTDHQSFLQKMAYSIPDDHIQLENQKSIRANSISIDQHYGRRITSRQSQANSTTTRGQSLEHYPITDQLSAPRESTYNSKIIRKTFQFEETEHEKEFLSDTLESRRNNKTQKSNKNLKSSNPASSTKQLPSLLKAKFRSIRRCFAIIKALFRMKSLCNQKETSWNKQISILSQNQKLLKYNESITVIKIKQWTQMVFSKMISIIQQKGLDRQKLNFIDPQESITQFEKDNAYVIISNIFSFTMSNLMIMTTNTNLLNELSLIMHQEQYQTYRKQFSKFVSERVNYISKENQTLIDQHRELILSECIVMNNLIPSLIKLTNSLDTLKCNKPSIEFIVRCIISLMQYFFLNKFSDYPKVEQIANINFSQYQLGKKESTLILTKVDKLISDDLVLGTYKEDQLAPLLKKMSWFDSNTKKMAQVTHNLTFHY